MYSPDLDDDVIPISFITTLILDINNTKPREEQLENMSSDKKVKQIWKLFNDENELKNSLNLENLWERPSLRCSGINLGGGFELRFLQKKLGRG